MEGAGFLEISRKLALEETSITISSLKPYDRRLSIDLGLDLYFVGVSMRKSAILLTSLTSLLRLIRCHIPTRLDETIATVPSFEPCDRPLKLKKRNTAWTGDDNSKIRFAH